MLYYAHSFFGKNFNQAAMLVSIIKGPLPSTVTILGVFTSRKLKSFESTQVINSNRISRNLSKSFTANKLFYAKLNNNQYSASD